MQVQTPDLDAEESEAARPAGRGEPLRMEEGAARQKVDVLKDLKAKYKSLEAERETAWRTRCSSTGSSSGPSAKTACRRC